MTRQVFLLDTNVVLALVRGNELGTRIDRRFALRSARTRPLVSIVTHGEVHVLARRNQWGDQKMAALRETLANLVPIDISHQPVLDAYVEIDLFSQSASGGAKNMGKNDLWIAACASAASATLLTTDSGFQHLRPPLVHVEWVDPSPGAETK